MQPLELSNNAPKTQDNLVPTQAPQAQAEPLPRAFERFTLLNRVARGGMGEVYLAAARSIEGAERPLIVKIIRPDHADDRSFVARFLDEARIQAQLQHPGVAQILEATTDRDGKPYVVVEYVEGRNLSDVRARACQLGVRVTWPEALALGVCVGEALTHIHERTDAEGRPLQIVHRDLSPQNVMVGFGGEIKLIDFGTARGQNRRCQTISGVVFAKPGYVAPEVANNSPGGIPADIYAFGVILWELLAGRRFLTGEAAAHLVAVGSGKRTLPPIARVIGAPPEIDTLLAELTATRMEERFASAREATQEIVKLLQRAPSLADGDRSVRGRISDLMRRLYPAEPARSRADFARRVADSRSLPARVSVPAPSPEPPQSVDPGLLPGTRYRLVRELGKGAMGVVHEAVQVDLGRTVALKVLNGEALGEAEKTRFRAEARAVGQLSHENLVRVYDFGSASDGRLFYAMELLGGETLAARLAREHRVSPSAALDFGIQACRALEVAHAAGIVHRDLKPANLFITQTGTLKLLDFGLVKPAQANEAAPGAAQPEAIVVDGTPEYMAPEQAQGGADARSDLYALGVVLYELVSGVLPFDAEGSLALLAKKAESKPPRVSERAPGVVVPRALEAVLERALAPKPAARFQSASALREALEALLTPSAARRPLRRRATNVVLGALLFATAALGANRAMRQTHLGVVTADALSGASTQLLGFYERVKARREALLAQRSLKHTPTAAPLLSAAPAAPPSDKPLETASSDALPSAPSAPAAPEAAEPSQGETEEASAASETLNADNDPAVQAALDEAKAFAGKGRDLRALEVLRRAAERHADNSELLGALVQALRKNRSWGDALRFAQQRAKLDPSARVRLDLAHLERATGHRERARALLAELAQDEDVGSEARDMLKALSPAGSRLALQEAQ